MMTEPQPESFVCELCCWNGAAATARIMFGNMSRQEEAVKSEP